MSGYVSLRALLSDRPIAFHPMLARLLGGINEALLFQQLAYWSDKGADPDWIYKTQKEIEEETTLTRTQQENARARLRKLGVIEEAKRGLPAKLYFRINWDDVFRLLDDATKDAGNLQPRLQASRTQARGEDADWIAENLQPLTKSTYKENTRDDPSNRSNDNPTVLSKEESERIAWVVRDLARELHDQAPLRSTTTRVLTLYAQSGLELDVFLDLVQAARLRTQRYSAGITAEAPASAGGWPQKNKTPYFLHVVNDLATRSDDPRLG